jgi:hypothetical protein
MTIDLTGVAVAATGGFFTILGSVLLALINSHLKDKAAREVLTGAVKNSLGAIQQAATSEIQALKPALPGVPASLAPGVQYVLDNAGDEAARLGVTPDVIAQKIEAKIGLANIATNLATTANATPDVVPPLAPVTEGPKP